MTEPNIWLVLLLGMVDVKAAKPFADEDLRDYESRISTHIPRRVEMLKEVTNRTTAPDVTLFFLVKRETNWPQLPGSV